MSSSAVEIQEARAQSAQVSDEALTVDLVDGRTVIVPLVWFPRLWHGRPQERNRFEIFGDGAYIHWPDLDEDLTVAGLLAGRQSGESPESLRKWLGSRKAGRKGRRIKVKRRARGHGPLGRLPKAASSQRGGIVRTDGSA
jgi:hypothetical protein